ncbi:uncharacterized protein LOC117663194 [Pantherophis guttatus]|uniref:Uncharacterized protein LOC117663194 n=1 Tax=Pantherophis guttatus TaxID=94885 RepID=A0A6P9BG34_PANGU|nr:uncharacterized protein LOC117663194 [Pantherophis guttatus]
MPRGKKGRTSWTRDDHKRRRDTARRRREQETEKERAARLQKDRERHRIRRQAEREKEKEDQLENMWHRTISARVAEHRNAHLQQQDLNRERTTQQNARLTRLNISAKGGATMVEEKLVVPKEEEGSENCWQEPLIVQVWTIRDYLTNPSHVKLESEEEMHQYSNSQWQEFLKNVAAARPLEEDAKDFQFPLGRVKEEPQKDSSEEARRKAVLQCDPNISGKAWTGREKLDYCVKGGSTLLHFSGRRLCGI